MQRQVRSAAMMAAADHRRQRFALAVLWLGAAYAWASWRRKELWLIGALAFGLGLALWMLFHNWFYGGEFYFISKSGFTVSAPLVLITWRARPFQHLARA